jgi:hypothetical protein
MGHANHLSPGRGGERAYSRMRPDLTKSQNSLIRNGIDDLAVSRALQHHQVAILLRDLDRIFRSLLTAGLISGHKK